jgi:hypothetical protein
MSEKLQNTLTRLTSFIKESFADIETAPGSVISELLLKLAAALHNEQYNTIALLDSASSFDKVLAGHGNSTDSPIIDHIASNFNITRNTGVKAKGKIKVTISRKYDYNVYAGFRFFQPTLGLYYQTVNDARIATEPYAPLNDQQLYEENGLFYFILDIEASEEGAEYQVSSGTPFDTTSVNTFNYLVKAEAYGNFTYGVGNETDIELITRIQNTIGNARLESARGIANVFRETFSEFKSLSVCGANDVEMTRDKHNIFGLPTFGKADVYVRNGSTYTTQQIIKLAHKNPDDTWTINMSNTDIPGFYKIKSIIPNDVNTSLAGSLEILDVVFSYAKYPASRNNDISDEISTRFTKYQTAVITFKYAATDTSTSKNFIVTAAAQPQILEMQNLLLSDEQRLACADYLVKAALPCEVSIEIKLVAKRYLDTFESLNLSGLKKDIFNYINGLGFSEELHASKIIDICHNYDIKRVDLPIVMRGEILCASNRQKTISLYGEDLLAIPEDLPNGISPKTTLYFADYYRKMDNGTYQVVDNIGITLV